MSFRSLEVRRSGTARMLCMSSVNVQIVDLDALWPSPKVTLQREFGRLWAQEVRTAQRSQWCKIMNTIGRGVRVDLGCRGRVDTA